MNAWMIYEVGKSWPEADGDTAEAIDFMEYYAREMMRLADEQPIVRIEEEDNKLVYIPLGVGAVIPPWNFPCAITAGMTSAAFVTGNTVVLKPASTAPAIAAQFVNVLEEVGLPGWRRQLPDGFRLNYWRYADRKSPVTLHCLHRFARCRATHQ